MGRERATLAVAGDTLTVPVETVNSAIVQVVGGAVASVAAVLIFEASINSTNGVDGNWCALPSIRSGANTQETGGTFALGIGVSAAYYSRVGLVGWQYFRVRLVSITSGNLVVNIGTSPESLETTPFIATHGVSGTVTANPPTGSAHLLVTTAAAPAGVLWTGATAGLTEITVSNITAATIFVKLYSKATAPTVGTDVPIMTIPVAAGTTLAYEFGMPGKRFALGIGIAVTAAAPATDTTAVTAGAQISATRIA